MASTPAAWPGPRATLAIVSALAGIARAATAPAAPCPPLPPPTSNVVRVTTDAELQAAVRGLTSGATILVADGVYDLSNTLHLDGGIIRNNAFYRATGSLTGDVGISVNYCRDFRILHNTVLQEGSFQWTIEWRFASSDGIVANNLTDGAIVARDGATALESGNVTTATAAWLVDAASGDLHLAAGAAGARDQAAPLPEVTDDLDGEARPQGPAADVGADEIASCAAPASPVTGLLVTRSANDVMLAWDAMPPGILYNAWYVIDRRDGDLTRWSGRPTSIGVAGCAEPAPSAAATCPDVSAIGRITPLHYYNVRPTCAGGSEGP